MEVLRTGVVLLVLLVPVACSEGFFTNPVNCYILDGFLMVYCIIATALFWREKLSNVPSVAVGADDKGAIYQELERPKDTDPYQVLEPSKKKKRAVKKRKPQPSPAEGTERNQSLTAPAPSAY